MIARCSCGETWNVQPFRSTMQIGRICNKCGERARAQYRVRSGMNPREDREAAWAAHEAENKR